MPKQPLNTRFASTAITILESVGMKVDVFSVLGDTITVDASGQAVVNALLAGGGVMLDYLELPNRLLAVVRLEEQIVSIRHRRGGNFTDVQHWHLNAKFQKLNRPAV
jgi:hypothetical protein